MNTKHKAAQQNKRGRVKPTAVTWGNRAVMRDGYQRHPATHVGVRSNPHTPVHMGHKKHTIIHINTQARKGQACKHKHTGHARGATTHLYCTFAHIWLDYTNTDRTHRFLLIIINHFLSAHFLSSFTLCFLLHLCPVRQDLHNNVPGDGD